MGQPQSNSLQIERSWSRHLGSRLYLPEYRPLDRFERYRRRHRGAIGFDTHGSTSGSAVSTLTLSYTCTGSNLILIVGVASAAAGVRTVHDIAYNGVALNFIRGDDDATGHQNSELWQLVGPASGAAHNIVLTMNATCDQLILGAVSLTGVDQASPVDANNGAPGSGTAVSHSVTTVADNAWIVDCLAVNMNTSTGPTVDASQTQDWNVNVLNSGDGAGSHKGPMTPAGSKAMVWTAGNSGDTWSHSLASFKPAGGAAAIPYRELTPGQLATMRAEQNVGF